MKSYIAKPADVQRKWYIVDAEGKTLGRLATEIATVSKNVQIPHWLCRWIKRNNLQRNDG